MMTCKIGPKAIMSTKNQAAPKILSTVSVLDVGYVSEDDKDSVDLDVEDRKWLPLHEACLRGDSHLVEELIRKKSEPVNQLCNGVTPLHLACQMGNK